MPVLGIFLTVLSAWTKTRSVHPQQEIVSNRKAYIYIGSKKDISYRQSPTLRSEVPSLLLHELQEIAGAARTPAEPVVIAYWLR